MHNSLLEALAQRTSEDRYKMFVRKYGKPTYINEEMVAIGLQNFVAFFNEKCRQNNCIYDLSQIESIYSNRYDLSDDFMAKAEFECHYCDEKIRFGGFYTSQQLTDDVEAVFHELLAKKVAKLKETSSVNPSSPLLRRIDSKKKTKKMTVLNFSKDESKDIPNLILPFISTQLNINASQMLIFDSSDIKAKLSALKVPHLNNLENERAVKFKEEIKESTESDYKLAKLDELGLGNFLSQVPSFGDYKEALSLESMPLSVQKLLLVYWRIRFCKDKNRLLSFWMFDVVRKNGEIPRIVHCEHLSLNNKVVVNNIDFPYIYIAFKFDVHYLILEYSKLGGSLTFLNFLGPDIKTHPEPKEVDRLSNLAFYYFEKIDHDMFQSQLSVSSKTTQNVKLTCSPTLALSFIVLSKFYCMENNILEKVDILVSWILMELNVLKRTSLPATSLDKIDFIKDKELSNDLDDSTLRKEPSKRLIASKDVSIIINDASRTESRRSSKAILDHNNYYLAVPAPRSPSPKSINNSKLEFSNSRDQSQVKIESFSHISPVRSLVMDEKNQDNQIESPTQSKSPFKIQKKHKRPSIIERSEPVLKLSKNNILPDPATQDTEAEGANKTPNKGHIEEVKKLLQFYFNHDKLRYKVLSQKCSNQYGDSFIANLGMKMADLTSNEKRFDNQKGPYKILKFSDEAKFKKEYTDPLRRNNGESTPGLKPMKNYSIRRRVESFDGTPRNRIISENVTRNNSQAEKLKRSESTHNPLKLLKKDKINNINVSPGKEIRETNFNKALEYLEQSNLKLQAGFKGGPAEKCFIFKTDFFRDLVTDMDQEVYSINHKKVRHYTSEASEGVKSVFDLYQRVVVPVCHERNGLVEYRLIIVENNGREVGLFDPQGLGYSVQPNKNYVKSVIKYIVKEVELRTKVLADRNEIKSLNLPSPQDSRETESGNWCLFYLNNILQGKSPTSFSPKEEEGFVSKLSNQFSHQ